MSDKVYGSVAGFIQFPVEDAEVNGRPVRKVTVRAIGGEGVLVRVTVYDSYAAVPLAKGDFIAADGPASKAEKQNAAGVLVTYRNLEAYTLWVGGQATKVETPRTVNTTAPAVDPNNLGF